MTDPFTDVADELMTRATDLGGPDAEQHTAPGGSRTKKHVCPYCGAVTAVVERPTGPCPKCNMEDTPATRAATKARIGPWYVLQARNPSAPGMKWATLLSLVSKGQVTPRSVVRGPTTHQLWKFAAHVKGLSREFNLCYSCGGEVERTINQCRHCDRLQEPPVNPDALLESRDLTARGPIQREIKAGALPTSDMVIGAQTGDDAARRRNPEEGILSARELAAAFQLDFNPEAPAETLPNTQASRPRRPLRTVALLVLLAAIGGGVLLYLKPDYRAAATEWGNNALATIHTWVSPPAKPATGSVPWDSKTAKTSDTTEPPPATPDAAVVPAPPDVPVVEQPQPAAPETKPLVVAEAPPTPAPTPDAAPVNPPANAEAKTPTAVAVAPPPAPAVPEIAHSEGQDKLKSAIDGAIPTDMDAQKAMATELWEGAIDLERRQDYSQSLPAYQKLLKLNPAIRQKDSVIQVRIDLAKRELQQP